jgi:hypothetical protein
MRVLAILLIASLAVAAHAIQAPRFPAQASYKLQGNLDQNGGRLAGTLSFFLFLRSSRSH